MVPDLGLMIYCATLELTSSVSKAGKLSYPSNIQSRRSEKKRLAPHIFCSQKQVGFRAYLGSFY